MIHPHRRFLLAAAAAVAVLGIRSPPAAASPAMPRPLERKVSDADAVVIATPRTRPVHSGDVFDADVEECVKGKASGTIRVTAAGYFRGCCPPPGGWPPAGALEKDAKRLVLFLGPAEGGVRLSRDPVVLADGATTSAWFYDTRPAGLAPDAVRAIAALEKETDVEKAVERWAAGLEGDNLLLVTALLHRVDFVSTGGDYAKSVLGPAAAASARSQWEAGRARLSTAIARCAESRDPHLRLFSLRVAASPDAFPAARTDEERALRAKVLAAADAASRGPFTDDVVRAALAVLCALGDAEVATRIVALLPTAPMDAVPDLGRCAAALAKRWPATTRTFATATTALLDVPGGEPRAIAFTWQLLGARFESAEAVRAWAAAAAK